MRCSFLIILLSCIFFHSKSFGYQEAEVKDDFAVIYQDKKLTIPLIKVRQGKKLYVGDKSLNRGSTLAVVINNSIAYIKTSALKFTNKTKHNFEIEKDYSEESFQIPISDFVKKDITKNILGIAVGATIYELDNDWDTLTKDALPTNSKNLMFDYFFELSFIFLFNSKIFAGIDKSVIASDVFTINMNGYYVGLYKSLLTYKNFDLGLLGSYKINNKTQLNSTTLTFTGKSNGYSYGIYYDYILSEKFSLKISALMSKLNISSIDTSGTILQFFNFNQNYNNFGLNTKLVINL